jgi:probable phosphoglycerate mutase
MTSTEVHLTLVRHGRTAWNAAGRIQGHTDVPLDEVGQAQAHALVTRLAAESFAAIHSSDLSRVVQTIEPFARQSEMAIQTHSGLREWHHGQLEGLTGAQAKQKFPDHLQRYHDNDWNLALPDGESYRQFTDRVLSTIESIARAHGGQRILIATHGGVIVTCLRHALGEAAGASHHFRVNNTDLTCIGLDLVDPVRWQLLETDAEKVTHN